MNSEPTNLETGPESYQFLNTSGRTPTPPWRNWRKKAVFIDPVKRTIEARQSPRTGSHDAYTRLQTERRAQKVTVFVDSATLKPTTNLSGDDLYGNDMVATYNLKKLPFPMWETILRKLGGRSYLYVRNFNSPDDVSESDTADGSV